MISRFSSRQYQENASISNNQLFAKTVSNNSNYPHFKTLQSQTENSISRKISEKSTVKSSLTSSLDLTLPNLDLRQITEDEIKYPQFQFSRLSTYKTLPTGFANGIDSSNSFSEIKNNETPKKYYNKNSTPSTTANEAAVTNPLPRRRLKIHQELDTREYRRGVSEIYSQSQLQNHQTSTGQYNKKNNNINKKYNTNNNRTYDNQKIYLANNLKLVSREGTCFTRDSATNTSSRHFYNDRSVPCSTETTTYDRTTINNSSIEKIRNSNNKVNQSRSSQTDLEYLESLRKLEKKISEYQILEATKKQKVEKKNSKDQKMGAKISPIQMDTSSIDSTKKVHFSEGCCEELCEIYNFSSNNNHTPKSNACHCCPKKCKFIFATKCDTCLQNLEKPLAIIFGVINSVILILSLLCISFGSFILIKRTLLKNNDDEYKNVNFDSFDDHQHIFDIDNPRNEALFDNDPGAKQLYAFPKRGEKGEKENDMNEWPVFSVLAHDRLLLDLSIGLCGLFILISSFGLFSVSFRFCRPLLWIYLFFSTLLLGLGFTGVFLVYTGQYDLKLLGGGVWNVISSHSRFQIENNLNCCSYKYIFDDYDQNGGNPIPQRCFANLKTKEEEEEEERLKKVKKDIEDLDVNQNLIPKNIFNQNPPIYSLYKRTCYDQIVIWTTLNSSIVWLIWGFYIGLEFFKLICCLALLATRLPYQKNKLKNRENSGLATIAYDLKKQKIYKSPNNTQIVRVQPRAHLRNKLNSRPFSYHANNLAYDWGAGLNQIPSNEISNYQLRNFQNYSKDIPIAPPRYDTSGFKTNNLQNQQHKLNQGYVLDYKSGMAGFGNQVWNDRNHL